MTTASASHELASMPNLFIIAGPNGAGKTAYVKRFLPEEMRRSGCRIRLEYLWIPDLGISRDRIRQRVRKGGHDIPEEVQRRRFGKGLRLLLEHYRPLVNFWRIYDNTGSEPKLVIEQEEGVLRVCDPSGLAKIEFAANMKVMEKRPGDRVEESAVLDPGWETRASLRAMRKAYADVILENKAWGLPIIQWREGKGVVEVPAEQLEPLARRILEVNGEPLPEEETRALLAHVKV